MPILSTAAQNASLDNDYGTTRGPNAPDLHELALFFGDPQFGGVEVSGPGYARPLVSPEDWAAASAGSKSAAVQFADATGAWSLPATHWCLFDAADHSTAWDCAPLTDAVEVGAAGPGPAVLLSVFSAEIITAAE